MGFIVLKTFRTISQYDYYFSDSNMSYSLMALGTDYSQSM